MHSSNQDGGFSLSELRLSQPQVSLDASQVPASKASIVRVSETVGISNHTAEMDVDVGSSMDHSVADATCNTRDGTTKLRVYVTLPSYTHLGMILVSLHRDASIADLRRALIENQNDFHIPFDIDSAVIRTTGSQSAIVANSEQVCDLLDATTRHTFELASFRTMAPSLYDDSLNPDDFLYIRWITVDDAVKRSALAKVPVDTTPVKKEATIAELYNMAAVRLCKIKRATSVPRHTEVNLWLKEYTLGPRESALRLSDLRLDGTIRYSLDIFVQFVGNQEHPSLQQVNDKVGPLHAWGFDTTSRGISTFMTCLVTLMGEIERGRVSLVVFLELLLDITHFPPALMAFERTYITGLEGADTSDLLLLADVFNCICKYSIFKETGRSDRTKLEGSRQIFAWLHGLCTAAIPQDTPLRHAVGVRLDFPNEDKNSHPAAEYPSRDVEVPLDVDGIIVQRAAMALSDDVADLINEAYAAFVVLANTNPGEYDVFFRAPSPWREFVRSRRANWPNEMLFCDHIERTLNHPVFRIVDPLQLGSCLSADLPVITLSETGFVSKYDQRDRGCAEREFFLWNVIDKEVCFRDRDPGESISKALEPIIAARRTNGEWEIDAWSGAGGTAFENHEAPPESVVICIDVSRSMGETMPPEWIQSKDGPGRPSTKLDEVKEFFHQFSTRLTSYHLATHVGLVTFNGQISVLQPLTGLQLSFRDRLQNVRYGAGTSAYSALAEALSMLVRQKQRFPGTKCRIILLTDGMDNCSKIGPGDVCTSLHDAGVVVDSIVIGSNAQTQALFKISRSTGGYAFHPTTQRVFFQIFLLETLIDISARPDVERAAVVCWETFHPKIGDMAGPFDFPQRRPHPGLDDEYVAIKDVGSRSFPRRGAMSVISMSTWSVPSSTTASSSSSSSSGLGSRMLQQELKQLRANPHPAMDVYVNQRNLCYLKVVMQGPDKSAYENGTFLLHVDMANYPRLAPKVHFVTPVLHPNISKQGRICHPVFDREWRSTIHVFQVLQHMYGILMSLKSRDVLDLISTLRYYTDPEEGRRQVAEYVAHFATKTRAEHRQEIIGAGTEDPGIARSSPFSLPSSDSSSEGYASIAGSSSISLVRWPPAGYRVGSPADTPMPPPIAGLSLPSSSTQPLTESNLALISSVTSLPTLRPLPESADTDMEGQN